MLLGFIRTHVVSSFRVVEQRPERLVLQANWLDHAGCGAAFLCFGLLWLLAAVGTARFIGLAFCGVAVLALGLGLYGTRRQIVFDRPARLVTFVRHASGPASMPYGAISRLERRTLELSGDGDPLTYYRLFLITWEGLELEICESRDESLIVELEALVERVIS